MFAIKVHRAVDITKYSAIAAENEWLIFPGTPFVVTSVMNAGHGLHLIQMEEDVEAPAMVPGFAFSSAQPPAQAVSLPDKAAATSSASTVTRVVVDGCDVPGANGIYCHCGVQNSRPLFRHGMSGLACEYAHACRVVFAQLCHAC